jgi:protein TonB
VLSTIVHILLIALLLIPAAPHTGFVLETPQGAGGKGPAGGGGGGTRGTGGDEHVQFVRVTPPPPTMQPIVEPPKPVIPPPEVKPDPLPAIKVLPDIAALPPVAAATTGVGGGSGADGSRGNGPGSGGGIGSGAGPGRGSGVGPGTGGGTQANFPPSPTELFIPPLPIPTKVRGFHLVAEWEVDETGKVVEGSFKFTGTPDGAYNRRLDEVLKNTKFRPGTTPDGKPIRMKAQIIYDF